MTDLTDRYVGATLRSIPDKQRADIEAELRASIRDALEAKVDGGEEPDQAEREVLTALGDPDRLAAGYSGRPGHLIGPEHFFDYKRLLTVLLITVAPIVVVVVAVVSLIAGDDIASVLGDAVGTGISLVVHMAFWTTLVFALIERSDSDTGTGWTLSSLPAQPTPGTVKIGETIASVVFLALAIAGLTLSRTISPVTAGDGSAVPIFDPEMWSFWFPFLTGVLVLEVIFEVAKYRAGRWSWPLASVNLALNVAFAVPAIFLLITERIFNPVFFEEIGWSGVPGGGGSLVLVTVISIVLISAFDIVDGFRRARK